MSLSGRRALVTGAAGGSELTGFARMKPAGVKVPREIRFTTELPRTPTGKMREHVLTDGPAAS